MRRFGRRGMAVLGCVLAIAMTPAGTTEAAPPGSDALDPGTRFYVPPPPSPDALQQIGDLLQANDPTDAALISDMLAQPQAVWFEGGTPSRVQAGVRQTMVDAAQHHQVPILVAYNLPYRDCSQYSAGGATDTAAYRAWIDGFARGIGNGKAVVIVEPDGLGIIPFYQPLYGGMEWCQPRDANGDPQPEADPAHRFQQLNYAVDRLAQHRKVRVYLDATHAAWLGAGEAADRLLKAGVEDDAGFFLNVSNYQTTPNSITFGTWVSECIAAVTGGASWAIGRPEFCPSQYNDVGAVDYSPAHVASVDAAFVDMLDGAAPSSRFVIDTSRNGRGPIDMSAYAVAPYLQPPSVIAVLSGGSWCNPPGRGLGLRPTADTGVALLDAYLWIKTPGESDGQCDAAGGARAWDYTVYTQPGWPTDPADQALLDPLWGIADPAAGVWFRQQALELARLADPPLGG